METTGFTNPSATPSINGVPLVGVSTPRGPVSASTPMITVSRPRCLYMCGRIDDPGMEPYPPRVTLASRTRANPRSARGVGVFHTMRGGIDPGDHRFRPRFDGVVHVWKDFASGGGTLSFVGAAEHRGPQPISDQPVRLGFPRCIAISTQGTTVFVPVCWSCTHAEGWMIQGWDLVLPGWRWLRKPQPTRRTTVFVPGL